MAAPFTPEQEIRLRQIIREEWEAAEGNACTRADRFIDRFDHAMHAFAGEADAQSRGGCDD